MASAASTTVDLFGDGTAMLLSLRMGSSPAPAPYWHATIAARIRRCDPRHEDGQSEEHGRGEVAVAVGSETTAMEEVGKGLSAPFDFSGPLDYGSLAPALQGKRM